MPWPLLVLVLLLAACAPQPEPAPAPVTPAPAPDVVLGPPAAPAPRPMPERKLCGVLAAVLATESDGFAPMRAEPLAAASWRGREILPGTSRCTIEGEDWPRAHYQCTSGPYRADNRDGARAAFDALEHEIDACLASPIWFPREWRKGQPFEFAMGERLQTWTDASTTPPSQVVLKVQRDIGGGDYRLMLNLEAVR